MAHVEPKLGAESFSCPHCGAHSHQSWNKLGLVNYSSGENPTTIKYESVQNLSAPQDKEASKRWAAFVERLSKNTVTYWYGSYTHTDWVFVNLFVSQCYSCKGFAVWVEDRIVYPVKDSTITAHDMMPASIKREFEEAASIADKSPRGAAALLRLCIQKLMKDIGEPGQNLNDDIASLVRKGLEVEVQQALDLVRVVGNNAVHPGQIDLTDDRATALTLFELVNLIVERRIAGPAKLKALFGGLPSSALRQIEKRDGTKPPESDADS